AAPSEGDAEDRRGDLGVLAEELVEVAEPGQQQRPGVPLLDGPVLAEDRSVAGLRDPDHRTLRRRRPRGCVRRPQAAPARAQGSGTGSASSCQAVTEPTTARQSSPAAALPGGSQVTLFCR